MLNRTVKHEPRWPAVLALFAVGGLYYALPSELTFGPDWMVLALVVVLMTPALFLGRTEHWRVTQILGFLATGLVTVALIASLALLVARLPGKKEAPQQLLESAVALWVSNLLVFASWYWRLDAGGPFQRDLRGAHTDGAFLFPQMMLDPELRKEMGREARRIAGERYDFNEVRRQFVGFLEAVYDGGPVHGGGRGFVYAVVMNVLDHADDFSPVVRGGHTNSFA